MVLFLGSPVQGTCETSLLTWAPTPLTLRERFETLSRPTNLTQKERYRDLEYWTLPSPAYPRQAETKLFTK